MNKYKKLMILNGVKSLSEIILFGLFSFFLNNSLIYWFGFLFSEINYLFMAILLAKLEKKDNSSFEIPDDFWDDILNGDHEDED